MKHHTKTPAAPNGSRKGNPAWRAKRNPAPAGVYEKITTAILKEMDATGTAPWVKPWSGGGAPFPVNGKTGRAYSGINIVLLSMVARSRGFLTNEWWARGQVEQAKGSIVKGRPTVVYFMRPMVLDEEGNAVPEPEGDLPEGWKKRVMVVGHEVWNRDQCRDLPPSKFTGGPLGELDPDARAESLIKGNKHLPTITHVRGDRAFYRPSADTITVPLRGQFKGVAEYYSTLFHECVHSTGSSKRLARKSLLEAGQFGDQNYSKEELVAEMGAAFLCSLAGVANRQARMNSVAYLKGWRSALKDDPRMVVFAASQASVAADFIVDGAPAWDGAMPTTDEVADQAEAPTAKAKARSKTKAKTTRKPKAAKPRKANPGPVDVVGLGRLVDLVVRKDDGTRSRFIPDAERWLAWDQETKSLLVVAPSGGLAPDAASRSVVATHREFHGAPPSGVRPGVAPTPGPGFARIGLVESVTYCAAGVRSPVKGRSLWCHQFGDRGERGRSRMAADDASPYPDRCMPAFAINGRGEWVIVRRTGNRYTVRGWVLA